MDVSFLIQESKSRVEQHLKQYLLKRTSVSNQLDEVMSYSLLDGGKRIRAALIYAMEGPLGLPSALSDIIACSIECIHTASLVHDDLPAMDDDAMRRNKLACHLKYDEATAILCGDALLVEGISMLIRETPDFLPPDRALQVAKYLTDAIGSKGLMGGQMQDLYQLAYANSLEAVEQIYHNKTALMLSLGMALMIIAAGPDYATLLAPIERYGKHLGIGYQIQDDIIDYASPELSGKSQGSDVSAKKHTALKVLGFERAQQRVEYHFEQIMHLLDEELHLFDNLRPITSFIQLRKY